MFKLYFYLEIISYICSIITLLIICAVIIYFAIRHDRKVDAIRTIAEWLSTFEEEDDKE